MDGQVVEQGQSAAVRDSTIELGEQLLDRGGVDRAVLANLDLRQMEAERLGLPDQVLQLAVCAADVPGQSQRSLNQSQVGK